MKISLITPTFNSAATLRDTLHSIRMQNYPHVEHIIMDGGSKDDTLKIAAEFSHISHIISEPDAGLYDAMNKGIQLATGDIIGILNSDDFYAHGQVLSRVAARMDHSGADALYGDLEYVDAVYTNKVLRYWQARAFDRSAFYRGWMPPHPTFFVRRSIYEQFGLFDTRLRYSADYELMLRLLLRHGVSACYLPEVLVRMRTGGASNSSWSNRLKANLEDRRAWEINGLRPRFYTLYLKPASKMKQFLVR